MGTEVKNRRKQVRKRPNGLITVYDATTGDHLGQVANLTSEGLMLVSQIEIPVGGVFQLQMLLDTPIDGVKKLDFGAESLWTTAPDGEKSYFWTGFQIIDISSESQDFIDAFTKDSCVECE
jgi:hypothetical protein